MRKYTQVSERSAHRNVGSGLDTIQQKFYFAAAPRARFNYHRTRTDALGNGGLLVLKDFILRSEQYMANE